MKPHTPCSYAHRHACIACLLGFILPLLTLAGCIGGDMVELESAILQVDSSGTTLYQRVPPPDTAERRRERVTTTLVGLQAYGNFGIVVDNHTDSAATVLMEEARVIGIDGDTLVLAYERMSYDTAQRRQYDRWVASPPIIAEPRGRAYIDFHPLRYTDGQWRVVTTFLGNGTAEAQEEEAQKLKGETFELLLPIEIAGRRETYRIVNTVTGYHRYPIK
jgi:hypothetical protein